MPNHIDGLLIIDKPAVEPLHATVLQGTAPHVRTLHARSLPLVRGQHEIKPIPKSTYHFLFAENSRQAITHIDQQALPCLFSTMNPNYPPRLSKERSKKIKSRPNDFEAASFLY